MKITRAFVSLLLIAMLATVPALAQDESVLTATLPDELCTLQGDFSNDDVFEGYLRGMLGLKQPALYASRSLGNELTGVNKTLYTKIKKLVTSVAAGKRSSTIFEFTTAELGIDKRYTASELGVKEIVTSQNTISEDAINVMSTRLSNTIDLNALSQTLLHDCPYELYWCDKATPVEWTKPKLRVERSSKTDPYKIYFCDSTAFRFNVATDFADSAKYTFNTKLAEKAVAATDTAKEIVKKYAKASDYAKLSGYKDAICALTDYNTKTGSTKKGAGNPWQLLWVFDGDKSTKVVSRGYTKAFQYLCDMTDFQESSVCAYSVTGSIKSPYMIGDHTWNIVHINGKNYIADITNCDTYADGTTAIGAPDKLFMTAPKKGSADSSYTYKLPDTTTYTYNSDTRNLFRASDLTLSTKGYLEEVVPVDAYLFPDENFRACVSSQCDTNGDGFLYAAEIKGVTSLNVSGKSIASLKGIEHLTALTKLDCSNNKLKELNVSKNTKLKKLSCQDNALKSLDISKCAKLVAVVKPGNRVANAARYYKSGGTYLKYDAGVRLSMGQSGATLTLPKGLYTIEDEAFAGTIASAVVMPEGVISIGARAFSKCANLMEIVIPATVRNIAEDAFQGSDNVLIVSSSETILKWAKDHGIDCAEM